MRKSDFKKRIRTLLNLERGSSDEFQAVFSNIMNQYGTRGRFLFIPPPPPEKYVAYYFFTNYNLDDTENAGNFMQLGYIQSPHYRASQ